MIMKDFKPAHFSGRVDGTVAVITLTRPERKNPMTFESYAELLFTGRAMSADEGERWGFFNRLTSSEQLEADALAFAKRLAEGPNFAHMMTKTMLGQEWSISLEQAVEAEAQA